MTSGATRMSSGESNEAIICWIMAERSLAGRPWVILAYREIYLLIALTYTSQVQYCSVMQLANEIMLIA